MSIKSRKVEVEQGIARRNVQMFTGRIKERSKWLSCIVKDAARSFMTILVMGKDESFVLMNVRTVHMSKQRNASVHFAKKYLRSTHLLRTFAVRGNVEMQEPRHLTGRLQKNCYGNVSNVAKNFGEQVRVLKNLEESSVLGNARSILKNLTLLLRRVFTVLVFGCKLGKEYFYGMVLNASNVVLMAKDFMSIIRNLKEMVAEKATITSSRFALIVTGFYTLVNSLKTVFAERVCSLLGDSPFVVCVALG